MPNYKAKDVDEFIASSLKEAQPHLREIRSAVASAIPQAEEKIGYGKPFYKYHGWVSGCDVYKNHVGFEVIGGLPDADRELLESKGYKTGSVTFQIRYDQKVPVTIIKKLVKMQAKLNEANAPSRR